MAGCRPHPNSDLGPKTPTSPLIPILTHIGLYRKPRHREINQNKTAASQHPIRKGKKNLTPFSSPSPHKQRPTNKYFGAEFLLRSLAIHATEKQEPRSRQGELNETSPGRASQSTGNSEPRQAVEQDSVGRADRGLKKGPETTIRRNRELNFLSLPLSFLLEKNITKNNSPPQPPRNHYTKSFLTTLSATEASKTNG